jgi:flagellar biosynthesis/type III secretory pathway protein FliH
LADLLREEQFLVAPPAEAIEDAAEGAADLTGEIAAARDVRLFRARVEEAIESAIVTLRCDIAAEVVGRELQLAPASIAEIVRRAVRRFHSESPVRVRVHPEDVGSLAADGIQTVADRDLRRGDAVLEVGGGTVDVTLGVRLDAVLRAYR